MLEKVVKDYKKINGSSLGQLYFFLALCARTQNTRIYAFAELHEATSIKVHSPKNDSLNDKCKSYIDTDLCSKDDEYCFSATYTNKLSDIEDFDESDSSFVISDYVEEEEYTTNFTIKCKDQPGDITQLFDTFLKPEKSKYAKLNILNLFQLPAKLFDEKIIYSADITYTKNIDKITNVLRHSINLHDLTVYIRSYDANQVYLQNLLRPLTALKHLYLFLNCESVDIILPVNSFRRLYGLKELTLLITSKSSFPNLTKWNFLFLIRLEYLDLSCNKIKTLEADIFTWSKELKTLHLNSNELQQLPPDIFATQSKLAELYLEDNQLEYLPTALFVHTPLLSRLFLQGNRLYDMGNMLDTLRPLFTGIQFSTDFKYTQALYLSLNPWRCDCEAMQRAYILRVYRDWIPDIDQLTCADPPRKELLSLNPSDVCNTSDSALLTLLILSLFAIILLILTALYYKYNKRLKIWLYAHNLCIFWIKEEEFDQNRPFDAFISYAHQQSQYISDVLLPGLEQEPHSFRICVHERNWLAGACIPDQIVRSVEQSCRTILVVSKDFIESNWARMEFRTAHQCALNEGRTRIIIIKYDELPNLERLEPELRAYLKINTYLESNDPRFWQKLRYAMPHKTRTVYGSNTLYIHDEMELRDN